MRATPCATLSRSYSPCVWVGTRSVRTGRQAEPFVRKCSAHRHSVGTRVRAGPGPTLGRRARPWGGGRLPRPRPGVRWEEASWVWQGGRGTASRGAQFWSVCGGPEPGAFGSRPGATGMEAGPRGSAPRGWRVRPRSRASRAVRVPAVLSPGGRATGCLWPDAPPSRLPPGPAAVHVAGVALKRAFGWLPLLEVAGLALAPSPLEGNGHDRV